MRFRPACDYESIDQRSVGGILAVAWISRECGDSCWDEFLQETPLGQFQQSTIWAEAKKSEGWKPVRVLVVMENEIVAGFQILWRRSWLMRVGYVSKGPVVLPGYEDLAEFVTALLQEVARKLKLRALVVQPPDLSAEMSEKLACSGFMPNMFSKVNDATWMIDLRDGFEAVERRMSSTTRKRIRQARSGGLSIREGGRQDLGSFFELMRSTCRRQGVDPNPPDVRHLLSLWDAASPGGHIRLAFADYEGKPLAGKIVIGFGKTCTGWKKGWTSTESKLNPNDLSMHEVLEWASRNGYEFWDCCAFDRQMAIAMLNGEPLLDEQRRSRYAFFIRFGGGPRLLPEARAYFSNPLIRVAYRALFHKKIQQAEKAYRLTREQVSDSRMSLVEEEHVDENVGRKCIS